jgi:bifunctional DNA-binding transcriptional regulator/antitoxin component of YhaV-PrlF toxin-antitoxin module
MTGIYGETPGRCELKRMCDMPSAEPDPEPSLLMAREEKNRRSRDRTRISSKHQVTIPMDAMHAAGLENGDRLAVSGIGPGRVVLERVPDAIEEYAGALSGCLDRDLIEALREEWA